MHTCSSAALACVWGANPPELPLYFLVPAKPAVQPVTRPCPLVPPSSLLPVAQNPLTAGTVSQRVPLLKTEQFCVSVPGQLAVCCTVTEAQPLTFHLPSPLSTP